MQLKLLLAATATIFCGLGTSAVIEPRYRLRGGERWSQADPGIDPGQWRELTDEECRNVVCGDMEYTFFMNFTDHKSIWIDGRVNGPGCQFIDYDPSKTANVSWVQFSQGDYNTHYKLYKWREDDSCNKEDLIFQGRQGVTEFINDCNQHGYRIGSWNIT